MDICKYCTLLVLHSFKNGRVEGFADFFAAEEIVTCNLAMRCSGKNHKQNSFIKS